MRTQACTYGSLAIGVEWRRLDYGWLRIDLYTSGSDGRRVAESCSVTGRDDLSDRYVGAYDSRCGSCWLGHTHSVSVHERETAP